MPDVADPARVFVVHGRNSDARDSMFAFLRSLGLKPIEWSQAVAMTKQGSPFIGQILDAAFDSAQAVVVLLTPDEIAYLRPEYAASEKDPELAPGVQPRPNVLFEAGIAMGRDGARVVLIELGEMRGFSDVAGRHVVRLDNSPSKRQELAQRLDDAGCPVDRSGADWLKEGDFTAPSPPAGGLPVGKRIPASAPASRVSVDVRYHQRSRGGVFEIINNGTEPLFEVDLTLPEGVEYIALINDDLPIPRLPPGKSASINAVMFMGPGPRHFDAHVTASTASGEHVEFDSFVSVS